MGPEWVGRERSVRIQRAVPPDRGAAQHHFRTREELVTAAVEYGSEVRMAQMRDRLPADLAAALERARA